MLGNFLKIDYVVVCFLKPLNSACFSLGWNEQQTGWISGQPPINSAAGLDPTCLHRHKCGSRTERLKILSKIVINSTYTVMQTIFSLRAAILYPSIQQVINTAIQQQLFLQNNSGIKVIQYFKPEINITLVGTWQINSCNPIFNQDESIGLVRFQGDGKIKRTQGSR